MKAGIAVDDWKLPVFRKRLTEAGFTYTDAGARTAGSTVLTVVTDDVLGLKRVVELCQRECKANGRPQ